MCTNFIIMPMHSQFILNPFEVIFRFLQFRKIFTFDWKSSFTATTTKRKNKLFCIFAWSTKVSISCNFPNPHFRDSLEKNLDNILHFFKMRLQEGFGPIIPCFEYWTVSDLLNAFEIFAIVSNRKFQVHYIRLVI